MSDAWALGLVIQIASSSDLLWEVPHHHPRSPVRYSYFPHQSSILQKHPPLRDHHMQQFPRVASDAWLPEMVEGYHPWDDTSDRRRVCSLP